MVNPGTGVLSRLPVRDAEERERVRESLAAIGFGNADVDHRLTDTRSGGRWADGCATRKEAPPASGHPRGEGVITDTHQRSSPRNPAPHLVLALAGNQRLTSCKPSSNQEKGLGQAMERTGIEPVTSGLQFCPAQVRRGQRVSM